MLSTGKNSQAPWIHNTNVRLTASNELLGSVSRRAACSDLDRTEFFHMRPEMWIYMWFKVVFKLHWFNAWTLYSFWGANFLFNDQIYAKLQLQYNEYTCSVLSMLGLQFILIFLGHNVTNVKVIQLWIKCLKNVIIFVRIFN